MTGPLAALLPDGLRLHLQHGPIDLIVSAEGPSPSSRGLAYAAAARRLESILSELVEDLPRLRSACPPEGLGLQGAVAARMERAVLPYAERGFITPMAAVAGAVSEEILAAMVASGPLGRAYVNNGGDIALHLAPGNRFDIAIGDEAGLGEWGRIAITSESPARGVATSGRGGRSFSLGIADAVTVLARTAAEADAAATVIGNAVDLPGHSAIVRAKASELSPDSDLGERLVTVSCGFLSRSDLDRALADGAKVAGDLRRRSLIDSAALFLQGEFRHVGPADRHVRPPAKPRSLLRQPPPTDKDARPPCLRSDCARS